MGTVTYEDLLSELKIQHVQIIGGMIVREPSPTYGHQSVLQRLVLRFGRYIDHNPIGVVCMSPLDVIFDPREIYQPDMIFISSENKDIIGDFIHGAPDLVVEILSPRTLKNDRGHKKNTYERYGVKEYWIIDPANEAVEIYVLHNGAYRLQLIENHEGVITSSLLPGLVIPLSQIF